jgi:transcriptional regulator with XRE-family HTH domain
MSQFKDEILSRITAKAGGNSQRGMKEVASDLVNNMNLKDSEIAALSFMSPSTIARLRELNDTPTGTPYRPQAETLERIFKAAGAEISLTPVNIRKKYQNKPKEDQE